MSPISTLSDELRAELELALEGDLELPLLPTAALQIVTVCGDENCDARDLAAILRSDPALSGNVLRIVNSSAYAPLEPIVSLQQAVSRLGVRTLRDIAVAVSVHGRLFRAKGFERELAVMWQHASTAAAWAQEIARMRRKNVEAAFLVGLLHDVGRPVVLHALTTGTTRLAHLGFEALAPLCDGYHAEIGARTLAHWGLPDTIFAPVAHHHAPLVCKEQRDAAVLAYFADRLAHATMEDERDPGADTGADTRAIGWLRAEPLVDDLGVYYDDLVELWTKRAGFLQNGGLP